MYIECKELQSKLKESLLHGLLDHVCSIASRNKIIVVPGLRRFISGRLPETITVKRLNMEYTIYTDFPVDLLGLTPNVPIPYSVASPLYFHWDYGEYFDAETGYVAIWIFNKPKKSKK